MVNMKTRLLTLVRSFGDELKSIGEAIMIGVGGSAAYVVTAITTNSDLWTNLTAFLTMLLVLLRLIALALEVIHKRRNRQAANKKGIDSQGEGS